MKMPIIRTLRKKIKEEGLLEYTKYFLSYIIRKAELIIHNNYWIVYSKIFNQKIIRAIGDSHVQIFRNSPKFVVHHIGPATAFNLNKENSTTRSKEKLNTLAKKMRENDLLLFSFGEIDCRIHIYNQSKKQKKSINTIINKTIENYMLALKNLEELTKSKKITFFVYSVPPAEKKGDMYSQNIPSNIQAKIKNDFNQKLALACKKNKYRFINVFDETSQNKYMIKKYSNNDGAHYNCNVCPLVIKKIKKEIQTIY